jgi:hypothetical protein
MKLWIFFALDVPLDDLLDDFGVLLTVDDAVICATVFAPEGHNQQASGAFITDLTFKLYAALTETSNFHGAYS